jgi:hypothetical protein
MQRVIAILAVIGLVGAAASAALAPQLVVRYKADRDNCNISGSPLENWGQAPDGRMAKWKQENVYADWSEADLMDLEAMLASPPPAPYTAWEVRYATTNPNWGIPGGIDPNFHAFVEVFYSGNDWVEGDGPKYGPGTFGACDSFAEKSAQVPWTDPGTGAPVSFWGCPAMQNSIPVSYFDGNTVPGGPEYMTNVALDIPLVLDLILNPHARGIRTWTNARDQNHNAYMRGQWGIPGVAPALELYAVPEPATMLLIGLGGLGLLLRKKR